MSVVVPVSNTDCIQFSDKRIKVGDRTYIIDTLGRIRCNYNVISHGMDIAYKALLLLGGIVYALSYKTIDVCTDTTTITYVDFNNNYIITPLGFSMFKSRFVICTTDSIYAIINDKLQLIYTSSTILLPELSSCGKFTFITRDDKLNLYLIQELLSLNDNDVQPLCELTSIPLCRDFGYGDIYVIYMNNDVYTLVSFSSESKTKTTWYSFSAVPYIIRNNRTDTILILVTGSTALYNIELKVIHSLESMLDSVNKFGIILDCNNNEYILDQCRISHNTTTDDSDSYIIITKNLTQL